MIIVEEALPGLKIPPGRPAGQFWLCGTARGRRGEEGRQRRGCCGTASEPGKGGSFPEDMTTYLVQQNRFYQNKAKIMVFDACCTVCLVCGSVTKCRRPRRYAVMLVRRLAPWVHGSRTMGASDNPSWGHAIKKWIMQDVKKLLSNLKFLLLLELQALIKIIHDQSTTVCCF